MVPDRDGYCVYLVETQVIIPPFKTTSKKVDRLYKMGLDFFAPHDDSQGFSDLILSVYPMVCPSVSSSHFRYSIYEVNCSHKFQGTFFQLYTHI